MVRTAGPVRDAGGLRPVSVMGAFLTLVLLFYFLVSGERIAAGIFWIVPPHRRPLVARIWRRLDPVLLRYFIGVLGVVAYATVAAYIGLGVILGIQHAVLLALLTGVLETIPVIGPTAAAVIAGLVSLRTASGIGSILDYALYATLLRLIDRSIGRTGGPGPCRPRASGIDYLLFSGRRHHSRHSGRDPGRAGGAGHQEHLGDALR